MKGLQQQKHKYLFKILTITLKYVLFVHLYDSKTGRRHDMFLKAKWGAVGFLAGVFKTEEQSNVF